MSLTVRPWQVKPLLLGALLACAGNSHANDIGTFSIGTTNYRMLRSTLVASGLKADPTLTALWEISDGDLSWRWYVEVKGCKAPIGNISISSPRVSVYTWSWEGSRAYDNVAAFTCLEHTYKSAK